MNFKLKKMISLVTCEIKTIYTFDQRMLQLDHSITLRTLSAIKLEYKKT